MTSFLRKPVLPRLQREGPIHAFTVCVNYSDYLKITLPLNRKYFQTFVVVTEESDTQTIELARHYDCTIIQVDAGLKKADGATFNLSGMVYEAQKFLHSTYPHDWICKLDADVAVNEKFLALNTAALDARAIYGASREIFEKVTDTHGVLGIHESDCILGFFQLYWDKTKYYPKWSNNCSECDMNFMRHFTRRFTLKDLVCRHFGPTCTNWDGRVSDTWST